MITATFVPLDDDLFTGSSDTEPHQVNPADTQTAVTFSPSPPKACETIYFIATVSAVPPGGGTPSSGTVTFYDGDAVLGTGTYAGSGKWTVSTFSLSGGTHSVTAVYGGNADYNGNTSPAINVMVAKTNSATTVTTLAPNPSTFGDPVTLRATVTGGCGTPTGVVFFNDGGVTIGTATLNASGVGDLVAYDFTAGAHELSAVYHGNDTYGESSSGIYTHTVDKADTETTVTSSLNPSEYGEYVTFTATVVPDPVRPGSTTPTGLVTFWVDGMPMGQGLLDGAGQAIFITAELAATESTCWWPVLWDCNWPSVWWWHTPHSVTAEYESDANYSTSMGDLEVAGYTNGQYVNRAATTTVITWDPSPSSVYGEFVTFTAEVKRTTPGIGTPTGKVVFSGWGDNFEASLFAGNNEVTFIPMEPHNVGGVAVKAEYHGDDNFQFSEVTVNHTVNKAATTTELQDLLGETDYGQDAQFTVSVKVDEPGSGTPTGTVTLTISPGPPGSIAEELPGNPVVTIVTNTIEPGEHDITAEYGGDDNFLDSDTTADPITHTVNKTDSETTLESSANPSAFGQSVTFTATVEAAGLGLFAPISPTGTVTFTLGTVGVVTRPLDGSGVATVVTDTLPADTHEITAEYGGDGNFKPSEDSLRQTVNTIATTTELSGPSSSAVGAPVTFTATVSETLSGDPVTSGDVTFYDGVKELATVTLNGSGQATYNTSSFSAGLHPLKAVYKGTENFQASTSQRLYHTVTAAGSNTALTSSPPSSVFGQTVTFTATVTAGVTPLTSGQVTFYDGATTLGSDTLDASGKATISTSTLAAGAHTIKARFEGNADYGPSEGTLSYTVDKANTTTSITSDDPDSSVVGQPVPVNFTVVANAPGSGTPTGNVTVSDGTVSCTGTVADGTCTLIPTTASTTPKTLTATYAGDSNFETSSDTEPHTVNKAATTTTVTSSPPSSLPGDSVTITALVTAVAPGSGTPTGNVTFKDGITPIAGCSGVSLSGGSATCNTTALVALGAHTLTADYTNVDGNFNNSSGATTHNVSDKPADLSVTKADSPDPVNVGDNLTYIINVANHGPESTDVTLTDTLPPQVSFVSAPTCTHDGSALGGVVTCDLGTMNNGGSATVTIVVNVPLTTPAGTVLRNTARVIGTRPEPVPDPHPNTSIAETTVYRSPRRGDCNGDYAVDLADIWAIVRDIFDPTFQGTSGCDANKDRQVDAGDVPSTVLIMLNGLNAGGMGGDLNTATEGPALTLPDQVPAVPSGLVTLPVSFAANGHSITSLAFSVDYDETWLALDPTDRDGNGIPDAVIFSLPGEFSYSVTFDEGDADGEVDVFIGDISPPLTSLSDGPIAFMILNVDSSPGGTQGAVRFSLDPAASFGDTSGQSVPGTATPTGRYQHQIYLPLVFR